MAQPYFADIGGIVEHKRTKRTYQVISSNVTSDASGARCRIGALHHPETTMGPDFWSDEVRKSAKQHADSRRELGFGSSS